MTMPNHEEAQYLGHILTQFHHRFLQTYSSIIKNNVDISSCEISQLLI
jgi:hypothetical protein